MERLKTKYEEAIKSTTSLTRIITIIEKEQHTLFLEFIDEKKKNEAFQILRDSLIQRFEYSVDTVWKYIKEYLFKKRGIDLSHPKPVFRECLRSKLANEKEVSLLIDMIDDRNITSHAYKENVAKKISEKVQEYCNIMKKLLKIAKP
ncbi:HI0074 family nucleotidyltransferase substrate-binding subunit [Candidatus Babeliales bacterium]|nr:HI0074 family nucleotidyltransferase substrate-binding subunit [Candidatus Babeliales bacterium]